RDVPPEARSRTRCRLGMNVRELTLWACETLRPNVVRLPQISQTRAMASPTPYGRSVSAEAERPLDSRRAAARRQGGERRARSNELLSRFGSLYYSSRWTRKVRIIPTSPDARMTRLLARERGLEGGGRCSITSETYLPRPRLFLLDSSRINDLG